MESLEWATVSRKRIDVRSWHPELVEGLTDAQVEQVEQNLAQGYTVAGTPPQRVNVLEVVDVVTGRRTHDQVIDTIWAEARASVAQTGREA